MHVNFISPIPGLNGLIILGILVWSMFWKAMALWRATKANQRYWFIGMLLINTLGILEIIYLIRFAKNKLTLEEIKNKNFLP